MECSQIWIICLSWARSSGGKGLRPPTFCNYNAVQVSSEYMLPKGEEGPSLPNLCPAAEVARASLGLLFRWPIELPIGQWILLSQREFSSLGSYQETSFSLNISDALSIT